MIYHITTEKAWLEAERAGEYIPAGFKEIGFIHCSRKEQLVAVANHFYRGAPNLVLLETDPGKADVELRWENLEGGEDLFPHLYGALKLDAVTQVIPFPAGKDGKFQLPTI
jgi:uncharacterized protein (DUF952 family)